MARKMKADDRIRLEDGTITTVGDAVESGMARVRRAWTLWQDETYGNIIGLPPRWRRDRGRLFLEEPGPEVREVYAHGFELREVLVLTSPDGSLVWSEIGRREAGRLAGSAIAGEAESAS